MQKHKQFEQKLVSFLDYGDEFAEIQDEINNGWFISSLVSNGYSYVGILEKKRTDIEEGSVYIPPRKKIKFTL